MLSRRSGSRISASSPGSHDEVMVDERMSKPMVWILAARPKTLPAAAAPVVIGMAMAWEVGGFHLWSALAALAGALLIQIGTNFANDYSDFKSGADTVERVGPLRVTQAGLVTPEQMKAATATVFGLAVLIGAYLVYRGGWPVVVIGLSSILWGMLYTAGPYPLGYIGLADLFVLVYFGPVAVGGTYYVQTLDISTSVLLAGLSPGLFSVAILTVNNLRDIEDDRRAGKRTLPARFGRSFAQGEYIGAVVVAVLVPVMLAVMSEGHWWVLTASLTILAGIPAFRTVLRATDGPTLNNLLATTGKLLLLYSVLFSVGWLL